ncbi:immunity 8 family protein [Kutzneria sp. NPDC051319]|uniref:immunity 8 family protein n=1 Tax=Kutzneria sp. NPDC051319 TaxID=3155047 RepID=UPI0034144D74
MTDRAEIRYLHTPDIDVDTYAPEDPANFMFLVQLLAGPNDGPGEESFDFEVCTPAWLADRVRESGPLNGRHLVIVDRFHWPTIRACFERLVNQCTGATWSEVTEKLSRYGHHEFEDYQG